MFAVDSSVLSMLREIMIAATPDMPPELWWVSAVVLLILGLTAAVDAFTAIIPEPMIFLGLVAVVAMQGIFASWDIAAQHLRDAIMAGVFIWGVNFLWYRFFRYDALGMGDAKWTMLAVSCFGFTPNFYAWGVGSILASVVLVARRLLNTPATQITFGPFLFIGLCVGLFAGRF